MPFKDELKDKIPEDIQYTPEFKVFLKWVKQKNIQDITQLRHFINEEIKSHQTSLNACKRLSVEGTMNRKMLHHSKRLDFWRTIKKHILKYL